MLLNWRALALDYLSKRQTLFNFMLKWRKASFRDAEGPQRLQWLGRLDSTQYLPTLCRSSPFNWYVYICKICCFHLHERIIFDCVLSRMLSKEHLLLREDLHKTSIIQELPSEHWPIFLKSIKSFSIKQNSIIPYSILQSHASFSILKCLPTWFVWNIFVLKEKNTIRDEVSTQGCISCGPCSYPELTEDHVLPSA